MMHQLEPFDKAVEVAQTLLKEEQLTYDKQVAKATKQKWSKVKMYNALEQERRDLVEARDFDALELRQAKKDQGNIKLDYDKAYAEKKDWQDQLEGVDAQNQTLESKLNEL